MYEYEQNQMQQSKIAVYVYFRKIYGENLLLKEKTAFSREAYNKQRKHCVKLIRESKIKYFCNLNLYKNNGDIKKFQKTVGPNISSKNPVNENILFWKKID